MLLVTGDVSLPSPPLPALGSAVHHKASVHKEAALCLDARHCAGTQIKQKVKITPTSGIK